MPRSASSTPATVAPADGLEEEREGRQRDRLGRDEERERGNGFRQPDRAAVDWRQHEAVEQALLALGHERATEAEQRVNRIATQSRPSSASFEDPDGSAKWKTTRIAITNSSIAGSVSRARSSNRRSFRASVAVSVR